MEDLTNQTGKVIPDDEQEPVITNTSDVPQAADLRAIQRATGLNIAPEEINDGSKKPDADLQPVSEPKKTTSYSFVGAEDAAEMGIDTTKSETLDAEKMAADEGRKKYQQQQAQINDNINNIFSGVMAEEEARIQRFDNTVQDDTAREKIMGPANDGKGVIIDKNTVSLKDRRREENRSANPTINEDDLVPSYEDDEEEEKPATAEEEIPNPGDEEYGQYIRDMVSVQSEKDAPTVVKQIKDPVVSVVERARGPQALGDQALMNAVAKFKKDHFAKVTAPLVNSGFMIDVVGTGVTDLQMLYMDVDRNMSVFDYQLEQMHAIIRNVVGTSPKVPKNDLRSMIHADDFDMMAFAHICATLRTVETVTNCQECGKPFRISDEPSNLLLNSGELYERMQAIQSAANIEAHSLMSHYQTMRTDNGIIVTLGHPSYTEKIRGIQCYQEYTDRMAEADRRRFSNMLDTLLMIRKIELPNGVYSNSVYQHFRMIALLDSKDMTMLTKLVNDMKKEVLHPKFGIRTVKCPHCGHINKDVAYENLTELVFYHTTISGFLENPES